MKTRLYLTPRDQGRALSLEEFESADSQEGYHYELIDGRLEVAPLPNMPHEELRDWLTRLLNRYAEEHPEIINHVKAPARVFVPDRPEATCPEPDIAAYQNFPHDLPISRRRWQDFSPLLVVEVLSADNPNKDRVRNRRLYLQVPSIQEYWILAPLEDADRPSLTVLCRGTSRWRRAVTVEASGTYTTPLLPGFSLLLVPQV
jgi:Uma2 family endonuclease